MLTLARRKDKVRIKQAVSGLCWEDGYPTYIRETGSHEMRFGRGERI